MAQDYQGVTAVLDTTAGSMTLEFFADKAPGHVKNFCELAEKGFYNGTIFHRVIKGFMIQGGCPEGSGRGGPGYQIKAEFNETPHVRGILSMARSQDPNSAGSQFFICHGEARFLDRNYTAFGKLVGGNDTLDKIATAQVKKGGEGSSPVSPVKINKVEIKRPVAKA